ncbi:MAG: DNA recombination protein RmuC [SAR86 cluster bacterium]|nr:DNA recombination protein RmuC [SAR86 cluster bacterium]
MSIFLVSILCLLFLTLGVSIGLFFSPKIIKGTFQSLFSDTAKAVLENVAEEEEKKAIHKNEKHDLVMSSKMADVEKTITKSIKNLEEAVSKADTTWKTQTEKLDKGFEGLSKSHTAWAEALSNTRIQGSLGEESLKTLLKDAGFVEGVSFDIQRTFKNQEGEQFRPDFTINTADGGIIFIDSKVPINAFQEAMQVDDEIDKKKLMKKHAESLLSHAKQLGSKKYQDLDGGSPDFTIMYLHNVALFISAIEEIPDLVEQAAKLKVIICPPVLVYATLKTVMLAMVQRDLEDNAKEVAQAGNELHKRLKNFLSRFSKIEKGLSDAVSGFNSAKSSWDSRLMPQARKFESLISLDSKDSIEELKSVETLSSEETHSLGMDKEE